MTPRFSRVFSSRLSVSRKDFELVRRTVAPVRGGKTAVPLGPGLPVSDAAFGDCVGCDCLDGFCTDNGDPANPWHFSARLRLFYENGTVLETQTMLSAPLVGGYLGHFDERGNRCCLANRRVVAAAARAQATLRGFRRGNVPLPTDERVRELYQGLFIPEVPSEGDPDVFDAWLSFWKRSGRLVKMVDGRWYADSKILPVHRDKKVLRWKDGLVREIPGHEPMFDRLPVLSPEDLDGAEDVVLWPHGEWEIPEPVSGKDRIELLSLAKIALLTGDPRDKARFAERRALFVEFGAKP